MGQELNLKNVEKLLGSVPDNVLELFSSLTKNEGTEEAPKKMDSLQGLSSFNNIEILMKLKGLMDKVSMSNDTRHDLILALTPFLRPTRQDKAAKCLKALKLSVLCKEAFSLVKTDKEKEEKSS